ncbi:MAG: DNA/RNA non-specific endonuclease, partial [Alistipes sp.]|nr:DNA/RNA non-specific endonuclease [Alistipes sp.]
VWSYVESLFSGTNYYKKTDFTADDGSQNINIVSDTLFLVAGCYYEHDDWKDYDASNYNYTPATSSLSKTCVMPTHQFKMALRTKKGNSGKKISECSADELQAIAFWIEAFPTLSGTSATAELNRIAVPVAFVEEKMGFEFFPGVPASVKESCNPADWGF